MEKNGEMSDAAIPDKNWAMEDYYNHLENSGFYTELDDSLGFSRDPNKRIETMMRIQELAESGYLITMYNDDPEYTDHIGFVSTRELELFSRVNTTIPGRLDKLTSKLKDKNWEMGTDLRPKWLPTISQAGTYPGNVPMVFAANNWLNDRNPWEKGYTHFYLYTGGE